MFKRSLAAAVLMVPLSVAMAPGARPSAMHDVTYISSGSPVVAEGTETVRVRVHRGEHGLRDATIFYRTDVGTATEGEDYLPKDGAIEMAAPRDDRSVGVSLVDDDLVEEVEDFAFTLRRAEGGTILRVPKIATVTIADDDGPSRISFARGGFFNYENRGSIAVTIVRSGDASREASVELSSTGGGATDGQDYSGISQTVNFVANDRAEVVFMPLINDSEGEATEEISLSLASAIGGSLTTPEMAIAEILDDDSDSSDTAAPVTQFHRPKQGSRYKAGRFGSLHVITSDDASGVAALRGALRQKSRAGKCKWYNGKKFVGGPCSHPRWNELDVRPFVYWQLQRRLSPTTKATGIKNYTAYALAIDKAGNEESALERGRNRNTFRIK